MNYLAAFLFLFVSVAASAQVQVSKETMDRGKNLYNANCLACHQMDGSGVPGLAPALAANKNVEMEPKKIITIVLSGLQGEIEVNGSTFNGVMPAQPHLADAEIADILTYIRNSWENKAEPIKAETVKSVRASLN